MEKIFNFIVATATSEIEFISAIVSVPSRRSVVAACIGED